MEMLPNRNFQSKLILLSKNFGSFAAIRAGLEAAEGECFAVMAADLQEPPDLAISFFRALQNTDVDVIVGTRRKRHDPLLSRTFSSIFWWLFRKLIMPDVPPGGVDVFGCNTRFRDELLRLRESHSSLVGQLYWLGFKRSTIEYDRLPRLEGRSAWSFRRKLDYLLDSLYSFSDLPIRLLIRLGVLFLLSAGLLAVILIAGKLSGGIDVPGYTTTLFVLLAFGGLNALGLGIVGTYAWRAYENTKARSLAVVLTHHKFPEGSKS